MTAIACCCPLVSATRPYRILLNCSHQQKTTISGKFLHASSGKAMGSKQLFSFILLCCGCCSTVLSYDSRNHNQDLVFTFGITFVVTYVITFVITNVGSGWFRFSRLTATHPISYYFVITFVITFVFTFVITCVFTVVSCRDLTQSFCFQGTSMADLIAGLNTLSDQAKDWKCKLIFHQAAPNEENADSVDLCQFLPFIPSKKRTTNKNYPPRTNYMFPPRFHGLGAKHELLVELKVAAILSGFTLVIRTSRGQETILKNCQSSDREFECLLCCDRGIPYLVSFVL